MRELCHRCHRELPALAAGASPHDEDAVLFCPVCGAPQILLPEHLRVELPAAAQHTTGAVPPPRPAGAVVTGPGQVDWRAALGPILVVAALAAVLLGAGLRFAPLSFLCFLWTISGAVVALGLYAWSRPQARMDARVGLRVGVATGVLMISAMAITLSAAGMAMRFGAHGLQEFDRELSTSFDAKRREMAERMQEQHQDPETQQRMLAFMGSQEARAGLALASLGMLGGVIVLLSAGGGAFAGMLRASQTARQDLRPGD